MPCLCLHAHQSSGTFFPRSSPFPEDFRLLLIHWVWLQRRWEFVCKACVLVGKRLVIDGAITVIWYPVSVSGTWVPSGAWIRGRGAARLLRWQQALASHRHLMIHGSTFIFQIEDGTGMHESLERTVSSKKLAISRYTGRSELAWRSTPWPLFPEFLRGQKQLFPCAPECSRGDIKAKLRSFYFARRLQRWDFFSIFLLQYSHPLVCRAFFFPFGPFICSPTPHRVLFIRVWFISSACVRRDVDCAVFLRSYDR